MSQISDGKNMPAENQKTDDFSTAVFPFTEDGAKSAPSSPKHTPEHLKSSGGAASPLELLKKSVKQNAETITDKEPALTSEEQKLVKMAESINRKAEPIRKKRSESLLAKCMPYIYDEKGVSHIDDKPDYTLESVEDIIEAAEKRASQKIARMYNLREVEVENIGTEKEAEPVLEERPKLQSQNTSIKRAIRIGDTAKTAKATFDTVSIPKITDTLFDDFSARRTEVTDREEVTTTYSELSGIQAGSDTAHTRIIPDLKPETHTQEIYEDILSHTRPVNVKDIPSKSKPAFTAPSEDEPFVKVDDFKGAQDISRVGSSLKFNLVISRMKLTLTALFTAIAAAMHIPYIKELFATNPLIPTIITLSAFAAGLLTNLDIFKAFKTAFTVDTKIEFPLAIAVGFSAIYFIFGIISGSYPYETAVLPLASLLIYNYCSYRKASAIFGNFKLVALRKTKSAVVLIDNPSVTSAMARSSIEGEVLAAGSREVDEIGDFLKNTLSDRPFRSKLNTLTVVNIVAAAVIAVMVGISYSSFGDALSAAATVLTLGAAPTLFISEMLPFASFSDKLLKRRAAVCSRYSAEKIEQINAAVITSADLFPEGCIKLYNINPLSANNIDETMTLAAAVAKQANSPLFPTLNKMLTAETTLKEADSVKYEENLGISGWVGDSHIMIGNRSLMLSHGVRIPPLEVDRKILHKGYFPIYVACDQRACALLTVKYTISREVESELQRLANKGVTLLVDNCDPNITEEMLCDYYSLYSDIIKILDSSGVHKYRTETSPCEKVSAHAFYKGSAISFLSILSSSMRLKTLTDIMYILHIICTAVIWLLFVGISLGGAMTLMNAVICLMCELVSTIITMIVYFIGKPFHN